jgi:hypothetical protein
MKKKTVFLLNRTPEFDRKLDYIVSEYLKLYLLFFKTTKSIKQGGDSLYNILKHSKAIVRILLICRDGTFAKLPILTNLKTFFYLGMEMNANVMHVKKIISSRSFQFLYYLYLFIFSSITCF